MWKPTLPEPGTQPLFRAIVQSIADDIGTGKLAPGARLPPHRDLADALAIARGTIARAYREGEKLGLLRSEVGRGTTVIAPDAGDRPYSNLLEHPTVVGDFSTNAPLSGIDPDPADAFRALANRPDRRVLLRYHPPFGMQRHRVAGARWLAKMGIDADPRDVALTAGAQHALFVTLSHLRSRARAIYVEELSYPGMHGIAEALGMPLVPIAMDAEGMSATALERAHRRAGPGVVYLMPTIHNPTGAVMSAHRRRTIAELARAKDLAIVEDAANRMLVAKPPPPVRSFAPERTFVIASVSKVLTPGLRVAFVVGPERDLAALGRLVWATQWMVSPIGAEIVAMWLDDGTVDRTLALKRREAVRRQAVVRRALGTRSLRAHRDSLHMWLALPSQWRVDQFTARAAEQNIIVTPSTAFWTRKTTAPPAIRISLGGLDDVRALESGLTKLNALIRER